MPVKTKSGKVADRTFDMSRFQELVETWRNETGMLSSITKMIEHPAYQEIIRMGEAAVPHILVELRDRPDHWFTALEQIVRRDPVPHSDRYDPKKARDAWLSWGKAKGYLE